jgi:hypothetical protein
LPAAAPARTIEPNAYAVDPRDPELREWEGAVARWLEAVQGANDDDEANRALKEFDAVAKAIWSRRVLSWNDIVLRAAVAIHWNDADPEDPDDEPAYPAAYLRSADDRLDMDAQALANLVQGIIDLSGLHFDRTGRVVPPPLSGSPWIRMGASRTFMRDLDHDQPSTLTGAELRAVGAALREVMPPLRAAFDTVNGMMPSAPEYPAAEARYRELSAHFNALVERLWTAAPSTWEGVMLLAEIAQFEAYDWPAPYPQIPLTGGDYIDADPARLALGHLAMAVLRMGGRRCARPALNETTSAQEVHHHE